MADPHVDGNAIAGPLSELFRLDLTEASARCAGCGSIDALGAATVYRATPGTVVRCCHCGDVLATLVEADGRVWLSLSGISALELPR